MPELSVIIPTYRAPELLGQALRSLAADTAPRDLAEIIVVDDGSPDFDPAPFTGLSDPWPLTLLHLDHNRGRAAARNAGIEAAGGRVIVFLDGDMTVCPGFLAAHAHFHRHHDPLVAVGAIGWGPEIRPNALTRYIHSRGVARFAAGPVPFKCFVTGNSSVPRCALDGTGCFDESFVTYGGEDLDLGYRLHRHGVPIHYLPQAAALHHQVRDLDAMATTMTAYGRDSLPLLLARHPELQDLLRLGFLRRPWWHPHRLLLHAALAPPLQHCLQTLARLAMPLQLPAILFDYLWWSRRTRGYLAAMRSR